MKTVGQHTLTEVIPHIKEIALQYGLKINRAKDFKILRMILTHRFYSLPLSYDS